MGIGVGVIAYPIFGEPIGLRPAMFTVVKIVAATLFRISRITIYSDDVVLVVLIFVSDLKDVPSISG